MRFPAGGCVLLADLVIAALLERLLGGQILRRAARGRVYLQGVGQPRRFGLTADCSFQIRSAVVLNPIRHTASCGIQTTSIPKNSNNSKTGLRKLRAKCRFWYMPTVASLH